MATSNRTLAAMGTRMDTIDLEEIDQEISRITKEEKDGVSRGKNMKDKV